MILTAPPPENWRPPGRPHIMWMNTVQQDLRTRNLTLNKAVNLAQNHPLWRLISTYGWWRGRVVEHQSLASELSLSCAQPASDE